MAAIRLPYKQKEVSTITGLEPCIMCNEKNYSASLEQLRRIKDYIKRSKTLEYPDTNNIEKHVDIADAFIRSTKNHCPYGLQCSALSNMTAQANQIAREIENDIIIFIQHADESKLHDLLALTQGYFPAAYSTIEKYWYKCHKGSDFDMEKSQRYTKE